MIVNNNLKKRLQHEGYGKKNGVVNYSLPDQLVQAIGVVGSDTAPPADRSIEQSTGNNILLHVAKDISLRY